jgi:NAD(P)-dependent dehydrogenase (short-subunit alcohol dehydrogenase family)
LRPHLTFTLQKAAADVSALTDGKLDYLLANAASVSDYDAYETLASLGSDPAGLTNEFRSVMDTNVLSAIHLVNLFMPLVLAGAAKKVVIISTGLADRDLTNDYELELAPIYAISKAAVNMVVAKFNATYKKDGVLFLALSPGLVDVGKYPDPAKMNPVHLERMQNMFGKFKAYAPNFKGPIQPEESATKVLSFIHRATVAEHGGAFMSHLGTKTWLESEP